MLGPVVLALGAQPVIAQTTTELKCNDKVLQGNYASTSTGFVIIGGVAQPLASVRTSVFDGVGGFTGAGWEAVGGGRPVGFTTTGTYKVRRDCTVLLSASIVGGSGGVSYQFGVIADNGNRLHAIRADGSYVLTLDYDRIAQ